MRGKLTANIPRYPDLGDAGRAIVITNSERNTAACPLRHWFQHSLGLGERTSKVSAASFGTGFHSVQDAIWRSVIATGEAPLDEVVEEAIATVVAGWRELLSEVYSLADLAVDEDRLRGVVEGWRHGFDFGSFLEEFEPVFVERAFLAPIVDPETGSPLRASMRIVQEEDENGVEVIRLARPGETGWRRVQWPWLFAGRIDLVVRARRSGVLWLVDHKTTASPGTLASTLTSDPQSASYAWLVEQSLGERVAGFMWNIVDSAAPSEPRILKNGGISVAANQRVPSWRVRDWLRGREVESREAIEELGAGLATRTAERAAMIADLDDLARVEPIEEQVEEQVEESTEKRSMREAIEARIVADRIEVEKAIEVVESLLARDRASATEFADAQQVTVDHRWCMIEQYGISEEDSLIAGAEIHADAIRLARLYRDGLVDDRLALATTHPRVPVCRAPGAFCSYRGPCSSDGALARSAFDVRPTRSWTSAKQSPGDSSAPSVEAPSTLPTTNGDFEW